MFNIADYLKRFQTLAPPDEFVRKSVSKLVYEVLKIEVPHKDISVVHGVVHIKTSPAVKGRIFLKKQAILVRLKEELGEKAPKDVR